MTYTTMDEAAEHFLENEIYYFDLLLQGGLLRKSIDCWENNETSVINAIKLMLMLSSTFVRNHVRCVLIKKITGICG